MRLLFRGGPFVLAGGAVGGCRGCRAGIAPRRYSGSLSGPAAASCLLRCRSARSTPQTAARRGTRQPHGIGAVGGHGDGTAGPKRSSADRWGSLGSLTCFGFWLLRDQRLGAGDERWRRLGRWRCRLSAGWPGCRSGGGRGSPAGCRDGWQRCSGRDGSAHVGGSWLAGRRGQGEALGGCARACLSRLGCQRRAARRAARWGGTRAGALWLSADVRPWTLAAVGCPERHKPPQRR